MSDDEDDDLFSYHARTFDPETAKSAGRAIKATGIMLQVLRYLLRTREPRNGWEMSQALEMPTITVVPRLAPLRRQGAIKIECNRAGPPPYNRAQLAYVITDKGRRILTGEIDLQLNPPMEPWEDRTKLRDFLLRALHDGWTDELRAEVEAAFATYRPDAEADE